jgi:hypothetical protein
MLAERLILDLQRAFDYTGDNNRDLLQDETYQFLISYISRNSSMIEVNLSD